MNVYLVIKKGKKVFSSIEDAAGCYGFDTVEGVEAMSKGDSGGVVDIVEIIRREEDGFEYSWSPAAKKSLESFNESTERAIYMSVAKLVSDDRFAPLVMRSSKLRIFGQCYELVLKPLIEEEFGDVD